MATRTLTMVVFALVLSLVAAACSSEPATSPSTSSSRSTQVTTTVVSASAGTSDVGMDELCAPDPSALGLDVDAAAAIPSGEDVTLGEDGAAELIAGLIEPSLTFCGLEPSSTALSIIASAEEAFAAGDTEEAGRILRGIIEVSAEALGWLGDGVFAAAGPGDEQRVRDLFEAARSAYDQGNDQLGDELTDEARKLGVDVATTRAQETNEPAVLVTLATQAALLGADDVADEALSKALDIVEVDLAGLTNGNPDVGTPPFDPCVASADEASEYTDKAATAALLGGLNDDTYRDANENIMTTWQRVHDYQLVADECGNLTFTAIDEVPGWEGLIELELRTCDASVWTGTMTIDVTLNAGGGKGHQTGSADAKVTLELGDLQASAPIEMDRDMTFEAAGESVTVSNPLTGTITYGVDSPNATGKAIVDFPASNETVSMGGMSVSMPVAAMKAEFEGTLSHDGDCG